MKKYLKILPLSFCIVILTGCNSSDIKDAGINTLLGMGTVFIVLILISFIISLFKYIPKIVNLFSGNKNKTTDLEKEEFVPLPDPVFEDDEINDQELVAVIAAAIAASEQTTTDSFVVRTIRKSTKWQKA